MSLFPIKEEGFVPVEFALLDFNKVLSQFYRKTTNGPIRTFVNRSPKIPLVHTVYKNGVPIVLRYRAYCTETIVQSEQVAISKEMYGANVPHNAEDIKDCTFKDGILIATKPHLVTFLMAIGWFEGLAEGYNSKDPAAYRLHEPLKEEKSNEILAFKQIDAAHIFRALDVEEKQAILVEYYGAAYPLPADDALNGVMLSEVNSSDLEDTKFIDSVIAFKAAKDAEEALEKEEAAKAAELLVETPVVEVSVEENTEIKIAAVETPVVEVGKVSKTSVETVTLSELQLLVAKRLKEKLLFVKNDGIYTKSKQGEDIKIYSLAEEIEHDEKITLFVDYLGTADGTKTKVILHKLK